MVEASRLAARGLATVTAACDVREDLRASVLAEYGLDNFTTDYEELVKSPDVDLVLILSSMQTHGPIARAAIEAGKHVLIEKPMARSLEEAAELVEIARRSPGYVVCAPFVALSPTFRAMRERLQRGDIGTVRSARARYGTAGPGWDRRFFLAGGGALFDLGVYNLTTLTGLLGPVRRVMAMTGIAVSERMIAGDPVQVEAEDNAQVLLDFGGALFASLTTGYTIRKYRSPAIELFGSEGTLQMLGDDWAPEGYELWQAATGEWRTFRQVERTWLWTDGLRHLVECIHQGASPAITLEQASHVYEVMVKAQQSGLDGQARPIASSIAGGSIP
jgi:predicted dehydrogenase